MGKMADVQLSAVTEGRSRQAIERQLAQWNGKLERHVVEQFQLRCYVAALQATELPNPKVRRQTANSQHTPWSMKTCCFILHYISGVFGGFLHCSYQWK